MVLPGLLLLIFIKIVPIGGSIIAFQDYGIFRGMWKSPWVGVKHFREMFAYEDFFQILRNTLSIGFLRLFIAFPVPLVIAILLNEVGQGYRRFVQTILYIPYLLSWVIVNQMITAMLSPDAGSVNVILRSMGFESIFFLGKEELFQPILTFSYIWKTSGYNTVIYLAALSALDPNLYEAAAIDGASRLQQVFSVTIPGIMPTIVTLFLLNVGNFLEIGFDQVYTILNPLVQRTGDIFDTYVYRVGLTQGRYSFTTAIGLFKSAVGLLLIIGANRISRRVTGEDLLK
jgi:putative aldouronate transport system permease protein